MKKFWLLVLCLILTTLSLLPLSACAQSQGSNQLKVGLECNYTPFNWTQTDDSNGAVPISGSTGEYAGGYDIEIAKKIAAGLGKELVIVKTEWTGLIPAVTSGKIDLVIAGMSPTAERRESVDFSDYYYLSDLVVVVRKDSAYAAATKPGDFSGAKLTAQQNTFHYTVLDQITGLNKQAAMKDFPSMIVAVNTKKIDGYISEKPGAISAVAANPDLTYVSFAEGQGFTYTNDDVSIAVAAKKGSTELIGKINTILSGISQDERNQWMDEAVKNQPISAE
ncbi:MAG: transporter substrate-binding domain-containing protein [Clostridiaceae bacterium]|nr:transporter substrate-binding domain-containing protein [Clostridiaceae bacterium]